METKHTNKPLLYRGIKTMAGTAVMMFAGPTLFYIANINKNTTVYWPLLIISLLICFGAIYLAFRGLKIIMKSLFDAPPAPTQNQDATEDSN